MKKHLFFGCLSLALLACGSSVQPDHSAVTPRPLAAAAAVRIASIEQTESIPATTVYLQSTTINAPITGYITQVLVRPGDHVRPGQLLYVIESREKKALGRWPIPTPPHDTAAGAFGVFKIVAPAGGYITRMDQQQPQTFVTEGLLLCIVADPATIRFQLDVPFEEINLVRQNLICRIQLPDGSLMQARIDQPLTRVSTSSQAAPYLAVPEDHRFLPEGLIATARLITHYKKDALLVPNAAVLSDELMRHFWVMRVGTDSVAIKVPITIGLKNDSLTEAQSSTLRAGDRVLVSGNYGLPDTALVTLSTSNAPIQQR